MSVGMNECKTYLCIYVMKETPLHCNLQRYRYLFILFELCIADEAVVEGHLVSAVEPDYPVGVQVVVVQLTLYKSGLRIRIILFEDPFRLFLFHCSVPLLIYLRFILKKYHYKKSVLFV